MSILAVDFGTKRIGLAISQGFLAQPLTVLPNNQKTFSNLKKICQKFEVEKIIVGLPEGRLVEKILDFAQKCQELLKVEIEFESEVLTTKKAGKFLIESGAPAKKRRQIIDAATAAVILQDYLEKTK